MSLELDTGVWGEAGVSAREAKALLGTRLGIYTAN